MEVGVRPATRLRILLRLMTAGGLMLLLAGCIEVSTGSGSGGDPVDQVDQGEMANDEKTAVEVTDAYWRRHFSELFGREYRSPQVAGGYVGNDGPPCGGEPSVPFNAFYCTDGDFLAWDENLMAAGYERIGDVWVYLIIAHEWAHAIQARLDRGLVSVAAELQADCLAGASLQGAAQDGLLQFEAGDTEELGQTLAAVADDFPWTSERDHGNAQQRTEAFNQGATGGATACFDA
jgi:predicted metalloprotease